MNQWIKRQHQKWKQNKRRALDKYMQTPVLQPFTHLPKIQFQTIEEKYQRNADC